RAQRGAYAKLVRSLRDVVRDHAVQSHRGEDEREHAERHEHRGAQLPGTSLLADDLAEWLDRDVGGAWHLLLQAPAYGLLVAGRVAARADGQPSDPWIELRGGHIIEVARVAAEALLLDVLGDSDDVGTRHRVRVHANALAD